MTALEAIQRAYNLTEGFTVSGGAVEQMAALRAAIREAAKIVGELMAQSDKPEE